MNIWKGGCIRFLLFFIDFPLFFFLTRIIPDFILQSKLADMELRIQSARLLMYKAALLKDADKPFTKVSHYLFLFFSSQIVKLAIFMSRSLFFLLPICDIITLEILTEFKFKFKIVMPFNPTKLWQTWYRFIYEWFQDKHDSFCTFSKKEARNVLWLPVSWLHILY